MRRESVRVSGVLRSILLGCAVSLLALTISGIFGVFIAGFRSVSLAPGGGWGNTPSFISLLATWWSSSFTFILIAIFEWKLRTLGLSLRWKLLVYLSGLSVSIIVQQCLESILGAAFGVSSWTAPLRLSVYADAFRSCFWDIVTYITVIAATKAYLYRKSLVDSELQKAQLEKAFVEARLASVRAQLDPHFLFNALHTVSHVLETEPQAAQQMLAQLGDLLRRSLGLAKNQVSLAEELTFLDCYLSIQQARFEERLVVHKHIPDALLSVAVPSLILQPIVENAIRHGIGVRAAGGTIWINLEQRSNSVLLSIADDGVGPPEAWPDVPWGVGLSSTRERLATLYPDRSSFEIGRRPDGGTLVQMTWPLSEIRGATPCDNDRR